MAVTFDLNVAGLAVRVNCAYESTRVFCRDFFAPAGEEPLWEITVTAADLELERIHHGKLRPREAQRASRAYLEQLALLRKLSQALPERNRLLFHGSALAMDGQGILFTAKSGTGKSTHARLWRECFGSRVQTVNDDKPFLSLEEEGVYVYGNPWLGKHRLGCNMSAPLTAIGVIIRSETNYLRRLSPRQALPVLLSQTFTPAQSVAAAATVQLVLQLSTRVPVYEIHCNMEPQAALTAWETMKKGDSNETA